MVNVSDNNNSSSSCNSSASPRNDTDYIKFCIKKQFDDESFSKFEQVLEYLGEEAYRSLYLHYNENLWIELQKLKTFTPFLPVNYDINHHINLKVKFYSFKFISNAGLYVIQKLAKGDEKAEKNFVTLAKILLYHGLISKNDTANFALVELEQLCASRQITLQSLYNQYRNKFLRLIIKAILSKLNSSAEGDILNGNGSSNQNNNGRSKWSHGSNCVITYMTRAFEVFNVATITSEDVAQSLIIITNLIHKEKYNTAIKLFLEYLASYQNIDICTLIRSHIPAILVSLLERRKLSQYDMTASLNKLCSYCDKKPGELLATKFTFIKARLLLNYSINPKNVKEAIYYLSKFEPGDHQAEDEFQKDIFFIQYLSPSMIGILLGVDFHFTSSRKDIGSEESVKQIESLCKLISMLDTNQVRAIHVKLFSTLSLLLRLRPERDTQMLNMALRDLWAIFISKLSRELKASLLINICVALYDLVDDCPEEVAHLYTSLLLNEKQPADKLRSLFFIPNIPSMNKVYSYLTPYVPRENCVANLQELQKSLDCVLPLMRLENQRCRSIALAKLKQLLQSNQQLILYNMSLNPDEPLDKMTSKTIESLLALSSNQDVECSALIAECLGMLGAVNPIRLDHLIYGEISEHRSTVVQSSSDPFFVVDLIERLKNSLFSDRRSESETANYALQNVIKSFGVFSDSNIKDKLSEEALRACELCRNTSYSGTKKAQPDITSSVYEKFKSESQYSYREWVDKFSLNLISMIKSKSTQRVLYACSYVFKYNLKLAEFLLPRAIVYMIINQPADSTIIRKEVMAIVEEDVGVSTQDLDNVYSEDVRGNSQTLHFQCANMIFCALDLVERSHLNMRTSKAQTTLTSAQLESMRDFLSFIPKDRLALLASKCRSHARALRYFEQHLATNKNNFNKYATDLQRIYVALDDTYEAASVENIRTSQPSINDDIANYEACGKFEEAFTKYSASFETLVENIGFETYIENALRCLSNQGDHHKLDDRSSKLLSKYPKYKRNILPHAIEAQWTLGRWDELNSTVEKEQLDNLLELGSVSKGYLLNTFIESSEKTSERLAIVRHKLMKPLSIAMMDRSAYFRGYQNLLVLHSIYDFGLSLGVIDENLFDLQQFDENTTDLMRASLTKRLDSLFDLWDKRNKLVQPSLRSLEPLLVWQRSIAKAISKKYPFMIDKIKVDVGKMLLTSADLAREAGSFNRSFYCLSHAAEWFGSGFDKLSLDLRVNYEIEGAKLEWDKGDQRGAVRMLKRSLDKLKEHGLYRHLNNRLQQSHSTDPFPKLNDLQTCTECECYNLSDRESFAKLKMLLAQYSEDRVGIPVTLFFMYEECVHLGVNQEETYFKLARYYDKLLNNYMDNPQLCGEQIHDEKYLHDATQRFSQNLMSGDREEVYTKLMEHSIIAFGNSLKYGVRYLNESMPRLLNIWYDLGSKKCKPSSNSRLISSRIESTVRFLDELKMKIPPYYFMTAISLLLSRVCHPHSGVSKKTCEIIELLLTNYPHQISWLLIALLNDSDNEDRKKAARQIINNVRRRNGVISQIVKDTVDFSQAILDICFNFGPHDRLNRKKNLKGFVKLADICPTAARFDFSKANVIPPIQSTIRAVLPMDNGCNNLNEHVIFPEHNISYIRSIEKNVKIFNSLQQPRSITLTLHNGRSVDILCKSGDDLRKDNRSVEFLNLLNRILRRNSQSNERFLEIQTFLVLPLEKEGGIIEMVPNCESLKNIIEPLYKEKKKDFSMHNQVPKRGKDYLPDELHEIYKTIVLPKTSPAVLPTWFLRRFAEPTSWYMARLAFIRTAAVNSMSGYIIGLGDRHLDNILIDSCNGRIIHVDFNLLFHQGETLPCPEVVPFRLTHNIVAAFGSMGTEGNFRKVCEITMGVMRKEKDALLTTLKPFMHDPCSDWIKVRGTRERGNRLEQDDKHTGNKSAKFKIEVTERKLKGYPRSKKLQLIDSQSVEDQVDNLIEEATSTLNLSQMYFGWCPHV